MVNKAHQNNATVTNIDLYSGNILKEFFIYILYTYRVKIFYKGKENIVPSYAQLQKLYSVITFIYFI